MCLAPFDPFLADRGLSTFGHPQRQQQHRADRARERYRAEAVEQRHKAGVKWRGSQLGRDCIVIPGRSTPNGYMYVYIYNRL